MPASKVIIAHVPVLHRGYLQLFKAHPGHRTLYIAGPDLVQKLDYARKDLRALTPSEAVKFVRGLGLFDEVRLLKSAEVRKLNNADHDIVLPDDDLSDLLIKRLPKAKTSLYPVFLRWDRRRVEGVDATDETVPVSRSELDKKFMKQAAGAIVNSTDIWRRVGALLQTKGKQTLIATNQGEPTPFSPWIEGDPRNIFHQGVALEMSVFTHAEAALIAEAARRGLKLTGARIYVTTFPCPACAKLIAHSGITECYYAGGYTMLDGRRVMEDYGVKLFRVDLPEADITSKDAWVPYKKL